MSPDAVQPPIVASTLNAGAGSAAPSGESATPDATSDRVSQLQLLAEPAAGSAQEPRRFAVGTQRIELSVGITRSVPVQLWYPAVDSAHAAAEQGRPIFEFEPPGPRRQQLAALLRAAPNFTQRTMHAADAPEAYPSTEPWPLILFSHCNDCLRFSSFSIAEELAARGFVVAAPDHVDNTYYDNLDGSSVGLDLAFLDQRRTDITVLLSSLLNHHSAQIPAWLRGRIDERRIGMIGHSFGALTAGFTSVLDTRIRALAILCMLITTTPNTPVFGDLFGGITKLADLTQPVLFVLGTEDIVQIGGINDIIRQNFDEYPQEAWLVEMKDAGHYSVSDLCGLTDFFSDGCGRAQRITNPDQTFTFLDITTALRDSRQVLGAYFEAQLSGQPIENVESAVASDPAVMTLQHHVPSPPR